jgi:hypothetical protein
MKQTRFVTSSENKASTAASQPPSPNRKPGRFSGPRRLTPQEIESLQQDQRETHEFAKKRFAHLKPIKK